MAHRVGGPLLVDCDSRKSTLSGLSINDAARASNDETSETGILDYLLGIKIDTGIGTKYVYSAIY